eukprot:COSAG06_NODE_1061_length_10874_cov_7.752390_10_plen_1037_part_00
MSLQQRLAEVAKEFEDQKFRQLDLYQRQLRKARDALQDKELELAEKARELEDAKLRAEDAEAQCAAESQGSVEMTREIIALKFELAAAIELGRRNARAATRPDSTAKEPVFEEPSMPADVMTAETFRRWVAQGEVSVLRGVLEPECRRGEAFCAEMGMALLESCGSSQMDAELPQLLMTAGADIAVVGAGGRTPLHAAAAVGNNQLVQLLVQRSGVDKDAQDAQNRTPLHLAARSKRARVVQTLLQLGANADLQTIDGKTARDLAVDPMIGTGDPAVLARVFDSAETRFWNHSARAVAMHRGDELDAAFMQYSHAIDLAKQLKYTLSADDKARLHLNRARVAQRLSKHTQTMEDCEAALSIDAPDSHRKALAVRAESAMALLDFERAAADLKAVVDEDDYGEQAERWAAMLKEAKALSMLTHYEVLNVPSDATASEIKKAFRRESITWHPDKHAGDPDAQARATLKFKQLNEANQHLSDQGKRFAYDRKLRYGMGSDEYEMSYGMFGRQEDKVWREDLLKRQREMEGEMANSKAHREKVKKEEEDRAAQDRVVEAERIRRMEAEADAARKSDEESKEADALAEEEKLRKAHLESEMRRLEELAALQRQREEEIAAQRRVANDLADQLRQLQEQQLFDSDEDDDDADGDGDVSIDGGVDGDEQDAAYRRAYEEYLRRRNDAGLRESDESESDDSLHEYDSDGSSDLDDSDPHPEADASVATDEDLDQTHLDGDLDDDEGVLGDDHGDPGTTGAEFMSEDPFDSFRATTSCEAESDDVDSDSDGEVMAAAEQAMLRAEKAIHRHTATTTAENLPLPRVPPPPRPGGSPSAPDAVRETDATSEAVEVPPQVTKRAASAGSSWRGPRSETPEPVVAASEDFASDSDPHVSSPLPACPAKEAWAEAEGSTVTSPPPVPPSRQPPTPARQPPPPAGVAAAAAATAQAATMPAAAGTTASPAASGAKSEGKVPSPVFGDDVASAAANLGSAQAATSAGNSAKPGGNGWLKELREQLKTDAPEEEDPESTSDSPLSSEPSPTPV